MSKDGEMIALWKGEPIDGLSREELLKVVMHLVNEAKQLRAEKEELYQLVSRTRSA